MTKTGWIVACVVLLAIAGIGFAVYVGMSTVPAPQVSEVTKGEEPATNTQPNTDVSVEVGIGDSSAVVVTYTDSGLSPKLVSVAVGDTVRFVNNSTFIMWIASDDHPGHSKYDGTNMQKHCLAGKNTNDSFDQCTAVASGAVYDYTFTKVGTFAYHNHARASATGSIVVK